MKFHVFFLTITIQKKRLTEAEIVQKEQYKKVSNEIRDRRSKYYTHL
ncbi:YrzI family small protein [Bacillus arachidis]|uniref:YrzI family small protein n=1 Tax=Bacillus arachidis TaxID=2819290 RepID=A0ABS3NYW8_9BACI|nr:YrzI family small protein [Bacillus arachidis]MBO1625697.1 YrzI family small protein [Bacillus arachidis]